MVLTKISMAIESSQMHSPDHGAPCCSEPEDEESGYDDHGSGSGLGVRRGVPIKREMTDTGEDEEHHEHPCAADNQ